MRLFILTTLLIFWVGACTRPSTTISLSANVLIPLDAEMPPEDSLHLIDLAYEACLDDSTHHTTDDIIQCELKALESWQEEMEKQYHLLMDSLDSEQKVLLKQSQQAWVQFYKADAELFSILYDEQGGTLWPAYSLNHNKELVRARALDLKGL
jgi:uncharacterized protein YecT (DUF1311 family)